MTSGAQGVLHKASSLLSFGLVLGGVQTEKRAPRKAENAQGSKETAFKLKLSADVCSFRLPKGGGQSTGPGWTSTCKGDP